MQAAVSVVWNLEVSTIQVLLLIFMETSVVHVAVLDRGPLLGVSANRESTVVDLAN